MVVSRHGRRLNKLKVECAPGDTVRYPPLGNRNGPADARFSESDWFIVAYRDRSDVAHRELCADLKDRARGIAREPGPGAGRTGRGRGEAENRAALSARHRRRARRKQQSLVEIADAHQDQAKTDEGERAEDA